MEVLYGTILKLMQQKSHLQIWVKFAILVFGDLKKLKILGNFDPFNSTKIRLFTNGANEGHFQINHKSRLLHCGAIHWWSMKLSCLLFHSFLYTIPVCSMFKWLESLKVVKLFVQHSVWDQLRTCFRQFSEAFRQRKQSTNLIIERSLDCLNAVEMSKMFIHQNFFPLRIRAVIWTWTCRTFL